MIDTETHLSKPYWIVDILPKQVPADGAGQYFAIEKHFLTPPFVDAIYQKFANLLLKLNCYYGIVVCCVHDDLRIENPAPDVLTKIVLERKPLNIVLKKAQTMISITGDDHYMTIYNNDEEILELITTLAIGEGLYVWKPENTK